ncbi:MAG TPA: ribosome recycling factor [Candidatus Limnocylindrales bacterium]|nr:ribosome recycling factor [Candidatus Limnocylindrales bacterium]
MIQDVYKKVEETMQKTLNVLQREFASIRTGRASVSLLDGITVDYYGTPTPLNQVATLSAPESNLIVIQPWDPTTIKEIEKAILRSDLGLTPTSDGKVIRLSVPPLTEERRKQLVKVVKKIAEESRVAIRQIRKDGNDDLKRLEKNKEISEDELHKAQEQIQKITDKYMKKIDELLEKKEEEIMEI